MKKNILLEEEIEKIKKLSGINEAAPGPTQWITKLIAQIANTPLSDDVIREFEPLINSGKIAINKNAKKITSIDWANIADDEVELLFRSPELANVFKQIIKDNSIATDATAVALYSPRFKKIINGYKKGKGNPIRSGSSSAPGSGTGNVTNTAGKYSGNLMDKLGKLFGGRIDDVTLQKLQDPNSKLRLDLENELLAVVGKEKSGLVKSAIDKAVARVAKITEGLTEQEAYNKVFETALTKLGIQKTTSELTQKYFGWLFKLPWYGQAIIYSLVLNEIVNPLLGTNYSLWGIIKYVFGSVKGGAVGSNQLDGALERLKKSSETPENNSSQDSGKDVTTY
jgi:hypothetical protein